MESQIAAPLITLSSLANDLLVQMNKTSEVNVRLYTILDEMGNIMESRTSLHEKENQILALLGTIYDQTNKPAENDLNHASEEVAFQLCCYSNNKLASILDLSQYTNAKELSFSIAGFHNRNHQSAHIHPHYAKIIRNHTILMTNAALYYIEIRYKALNNLSRVDEDILSVLLQDNRYMYHHLLPWFLQSTTWSKFRFIIYGKCLERDLTKKFFYDPQYYMVPTLKALNRKDTAHNVMQMLSIAFRGLTSDEFIAKYFRGFVSNYKAGVSDEVYNYNLIHYILPAIINAYPTKIAELIVDLYDSRPFFEDILLVSLTIAARKKLISADWCLDDLVYHNLQLAQAWIVERTLNALVDSKNVIVCFALLKKFMLGATYDRLRAVNLLSVLKKLLLLSITARRNENSVYLQDVSNFNMFLLNYAKSRFSAAEESHKQFYYEIFQQTRQSLPNFFRYKQPSTRLNNCATLSTAHFMQMLSRCEDAAVCDEEFDCYLQILLDNSQFHCILHGVTANISKWCCLIHLSRPIDSQSLSVTLMVYRKLMETHKLLVKRVNVCAIERIILDIIPVQADNDPNIFVNMVANLERIVKECVVILSHMIVYDRDQYPDYECNVFDFLYICEHILEYAPSKRLVFDVSRLHRMALKELATKNPEGFLSYTREFISQITGNTHVARRAMRRHPSITETMRNILIATVDYETCTEKNVHVTVQNELLNYVTATVNKEDIHFVLATEAQKVIFDTKEFAFKKIIGIDQLVIHILHSLDIVSKWEAITALTQLLQSVLCSLLERSDPFLFRQYFSLIVEIMSMVPHRTVTALAGLCVLQVLNFKNIPFALRNKLPKARYSQQTLNCAMFVKVLYESTIDINSLLNRAVDIDDEIKLERFSDETCASVIALIKNEYNDFLGM